MKYSEDLENVIRKLGINKGEILFLVMEEAFLDEVREGKITVEHKKATPFLLSRLFKKDKNGIYTIPKTKTYLLFQSGYQADSRRLLVHFEGWTVGNQTFPEERVLTGGHTDSTNLDLILGEVVYDSVKAVLHS